MFTTTAEFNGLSSAIYRNRILQSQLKILAKIQLSVIGIHTVDFCSSVTFIGVKTQRQMPEPEQALDLGISIKNAWDPLHYCRL